jgi:hypothetical protein
VLWTESGVTRWLGDLSVGDSDFETDVFCTVNNQVRAHRRRLWWKNMRVINMLFSVYVLSGKCVTYQDGKKRCLKTMKEAQPTFGGRTVRRCTLNSSFISIILIFLVLKMTQARILLPEQQGRVRLPSLPTAFDQTFFVTEQCCSKILEFVYITW